MSGAPQFALRPFLAEDAAVVAQIFRESIGALTPGHYWEAQHEPGAAPGRHLAAV